MLLFIEGQIQEEEDIFRKMKILRFLQNYDNYNCIFGIKLWGL